MKKTKEIQNSKSSTPSLTSQSKRARDFFDKNKETHRYSPDALLEKFANFMDQSRNRKPGEKRPEEFMEIHDKVAYVLGIENHIPVAESVDREYRHFITEMIMKTEQEYDCKTVIEKSLAETIALSHIRIICFSKAMNNYLPGKISINKEINDYYTIASKELDRAHRQLTNAILTLRQIKMPYTPLNITARTAFIGQNQQINNLNTNQ
jgi:hypothetical protein